MLSLLTVFGIHFVFATPLASSKKRPPVSFSATFWTPGSGKGEDRAEPW